MKCDKYIGMDVHQAMTVIAVMDGDGKVILETMVSNRSGSDDSVREEHERTPARDKLADLLRTGMLRWVYHGSEGGQKLKQLVRAYETLSIDTRRTMVRIKAI